MMQKGLIDILNKAKELGTHEELTPYPISCMTLIAILEEHEYVCAQLAASQQETRDALGESRKLRHNMAAYFAPQYISQPNDVARVCDEALDKTGELLGYVREYARSHLAALRTGEREG